MLRPALLVALAVVRGVDSAACPTVTDSAVTKQTVCEGLQGTRYNSDDEKIAFTGSYVPPDETCSRCDWETTAGCNTVQDCEALKPPSFDSGVAVWTGSACKLCSKLDLGGCNSTELCKADDVVNTDPEVRSFGVWDNVTEPGRASCAMCSWDNMRQGCLTKEACACVAQRPSEDDDGTAVWTGPIIANTLGNVISGGCQKCSTTNFGDACSVGAELFNQPTCGRKVLKKMQKDMNTWSCGKEVYSLYGTKESSDSAAYDWIYNAAIAAVCMASINAVWICCIGGYLFSKR